MAGPATMLRPPESRPRAPGAHDAAPRPDRDVPVVVPAVRIETLGRFRVLRGGDPVPGSAWRSRKARDLLKILVSRRGRPVTREALIHSLWSDETPEQVGNRLNVLLSTVRGILDPERVLGDGPIVADGDAISLDLNQVEVDVEWFLAAADTGLRLLSLHHDREAVDQLVRAEASYTGDFLEDSPYDDFPMALREEARATYREVAAKLARCARASGDPDAAIRYLLRSLQRDAYDEPVHLELVAVLAASGRHGDARRHYDIYCSRMDELDIGPVPFPASAR